MSISTHSKANICNITAEHRFSQKSHAFLQPLDFPGRSISIHVKTPWPWNIPLLQAEAAINQDVPAADSVPPGFCSILPKWSWRIIEKPIYSSFDRFLASSIIEEIWNATNQSAFRCKYLFLTADNTEISFTYSKYRSQINTTPGEVGQVFWAFSSCPWFWNPSSVCFQMRQEKSLHHASGPFHAAKRGSNMANHQKCKVVRRSSELICIIYLYIGLSPCNSHHKDYYMFSRESGILINPCKPSFALGTGRGGKYIMPQ